MKLTYEDKLNIYKLKKNGMPWTRICQEYKVAVSHLNYMELARKENISSQLRPSPP